MDKFDKKAEIFPYLSPKIRNVFERFPTKYWNSLNEIRITVNAPLIADISGKKFYITSKGTALNMQDCYTATCEDVNSIMELVTKSSVYAYNRHINEGFITLPGANRVGICGNCAVKDGVIISVSDINSLNFRLSHSKPGISSIVFDDIYSNGEIFNTLIISPPGCGKTTFLRDIACSFSDVKRCGKIIVCAIIDERYELACIRNSVACMDVGVNSFVISGYKKSRAIPMIVRSMAPDCIITDELCCNDDFKAIDFARRSGCAVIASVHGYDENINEIAGFNFDNIFKKIVVLSKRNGPGTIEKIVGVK